MWSPVKNHDISDKEIVGRRVFGKDFLNKQTTAKGRALSFKIEVFIEDREGADLSVDRLGIKCPDAGAMALILVDCQQQVLSIGKAFAGWAALSVGHARHKLHALEIVATPKDCNKYHADVRTGHLSPRERNLAAFALATLATHVEEPRSRTSLRKGWDSCRAMCAKVVTWILRK